MNTTVEIIEFTDPACTWCWGSEPMLRKLEYQFGDKIKVSYIMGGLVEDAKTFMDPRNRIGGDLKQFNKQVAGHWLEASERHGMPVQDDGFELFTESDRSTHPMNIAYKAAQFQGEEIANRFLRRMREAIAAEAKQANKLEVLVELANDIGLDIKKFITAMNDGTAFEAFKSDVALMHNYSNSGFPGYLVRNNAGKEMVMRGYQSYENFIAIINVLSDGKLKSANKMANEENILDFFSSYARVAPVELQEAFDLDINNTKKWLVALMDKGIINEHKVGNGNLYCLSPQSGLCDSKAGVCNL